MTQAIRTFKDGVFGPGAFTGGREDTPEVKIVKSNYYAKRSNEVQVDVAQNNTGFSIRLSIETLEDILKWAKENTDMELLDNEASNYEYDDQDILFPPTEEDLKKIKK